MADQVRTMSVRAIMDSGEYSRGAKAVADANKEIAATGQGVQVALAATDSALTKAGSGATRLSNTYIDGARALATFQKDLKALNTALETGQLSTEQATAAYTGMVQKFGLIADGAHLAGQGVNQLGAIVSSTNDNFRTQAAAVDLLAASYRSMAAEARAAQSADRAQSSFNRSFNIAQPSSNSASASASVFEEQLRQQEELARRMEEVSRLKAQQTGANFGGDLNARFGIGQGVNSARDSASVFEEQLRQQEELARRMEEVSRLKAQQTGANFGGDLNARFGIGQGVNSARDSASVFEAAARESEMLEQRLTALRGAIDPVGASWNRLSAEMAEYNTWLKSGKISVDEFAQAETQARQRHEQLKDSLSGTKASGGTESQFRRQNLGYQAFDVGQGLASGLPLGMIAAQQGPQIAQAYIGPGGGMAAVREDLLAARAAVLGITASLGPLGIAFGAVGIAAGAFYFLTRKETKTTDEVLKEHAANIAALGDAYGIATDKARSYSEADKAIAEAATRKSSIELIEKQKQAVQDLSDQFGQIGGGGKGAVPVFQLKGGYQEFLQAFKQLRKDGDAEKFSEEIRRIGQDPAFQKQADNVLAATRNLKLLNDEADKTARLIREISSDKGPGGFLLSQGPTNQNDMGNLAAYQAQQKVAADRAQQAYDAQIESLMARTPVQKSNAAKDVAASQYNQDESSEARKQRIELAGAQALIAAEHELRTAKEDRVRQSQASLAAAQNELSLVGKTVDEQNRLRAAYEAEAQIRQAAAQAHVAADEKEIANARAKAAAIAQINAQVAAGKLLQDQGYQIEQLQLEARLIGANADERARATAALQAEQQLRQQGIDLLSKEGQQYQANAVAMAQAKLEIDRQNAAYQSLQQAQGSVIDDLVTGTGTMKEQLKAAADDVLKWFEQVAVANPLKNALTGTNLPTLADLFSGKPSIPGASATSTAMMTVSAGVVNVTGGLPGLPGASPGGGLLSLLTGGAKTNGVRPDLTASGLINSPVAANQNMPANVLAYQQAISMIESGSAKGNYNALGPVLNSGDRAYGRYQVMGNNIPSWSQKYYGQQLSPQEFLANHGAQDSVFNGEFGGYASKYGPSGAASKWFTGSAFPRGKMDALGTTDNQYVAQFNQNLKQLSLSSTNTASTVATLGDSSKGLTSSFSGLANTLGGVGATPGTGSTGSNPFSFLFSLFGFADGTDSAPGGPAFINERGVGSEVINLPRGSQVIPAHKVDAYLGKGSGSTPTVVRHEYNITVGGNGDKELMERVYTVVDTVARGHIENYRRNDFGNDVDRIRRDPYSIGSAA